MLEGEVQRLLGKSFCSKWPNLLAGRAAAQAVDLESSFIERQIQLRIIMKTTLYTVLLSLLISIPAQAAENVVLITFGGLRWQETFRGIDRDLASSKQYTDKPDALLGEFWRSTASERAAVMLPFLYETVFPRGSVVGNRDYNSCARATNANHHSYPGYSEILTGVVNERIRNDGRVFNPEKSVLELLERRQEYLDGTAAFASWNLFPFIYNVPRSGIHVNAHARETRPGNQNEEFLNQFQADVPDRWPGIRNDAFTHYFAKSWLLRQRPRMMHVAYSETEHYAREGSYDEYIKAAHRTDRFIADLWETIQSIEGYRNNTVLFIAVDHGFGHDTVAGWQNHQQLHPSTRASISKLADSSTEPLPGTDATWMAAIGPGIRDQGLIVTGDQCLTNNRIAATLLQVLGEDYRDMNHRMGAPMQAFLQ